MAEETILLLNDPPISKKEEDLLNRQPFVSRLARAIKNHHQNSSLVIGLQGEWGSGKSSLLNLLEKDLTRESEDPEIRVIRFQPWLFSTENDLVQQFFELLIAEIDDSALKQSFKAFQKALAPDSFLTKAPITGQ